MHALHHCDALAADASCTHCITMMFIVMRLSEGHLSDVLVAEGCITVNVCPYAGNIFTAKKVYIFTIKSTVFFFHVMRRIFILSFLILSADTDFVL